MGGEGLLADLPLLTGTATDFKLLARGHLRERQVRAGGSIPELLALGGSRFQPTPRMSSASFAASAASGSFPASVRTGPDVLGLNPSSVRANLSLASLSARRPLPRRPHSIQPHPRRPRVASSPSSSSVLGGILLAGLSARWLLRLPASPHQVGGEREQSFSEQGACRLPRSQHHAHEQGFSDKGLSARQPPPTRSPGDPIKLMPASSRPCRPSLVPAPSPASPLAGLFLAGLILVGPGSPAFSSRLP